MCLLIAQRKGSATVPDAHIREGWRGNSDGAGYAFIANGRIEVRKFGKLKPFLVNYRADHAQFGESSPFIVHLRYSTHGGVTDANIHPFPICDGRAVVGHNGMLNQFVSPLRDESDTRFFARTVLGLRDAEQVTSPEFVKWLEGVIGSANKLAILSDSGALAIVNESAGHWIGDTWYSNHGYLSSDRGVLAYGRCWWDSDSKGSAKGAKGAKRAKGSAKGAKGAKGSAKGSEWPTGEEVYAIGYDDYVNRTTTELDFDQLPEYLWRNYCDGVSDARQRYGFGSRKHTGYGLDDVLDAIEGFE